MANFDTHVSIPIKKWRELEGGLYQARAAAGNCPSAVEVLSECIAITDAYSLEHDALTRKQEEGE